MFFWWTDRKKKKKKALQLSCSQARMCQHAVGPALLSRAGSLVLLHPPLERTDGMRKRRRRFMTRRRRLYAGQMRKRTAAAMQLKRLTMPTETGGREEGSSEIECVPSHSISRLLQLPQRTSLSPHRSGPPGTGRIPAYATASSSCRLIIQRNTSFKLEAL